jgi:acetoin utilization deacetylase AcuC-like enzyme
MSHTKEYVEAMYKGLKPLCETNWLRRSKELITSLEYTNSSLYAAMYYASQNPNYITFSPIAGFHHSHPENGSGFCSFSGQVIASVKLYREFGIRTAWLDLDGHLGTSIET